MATKVLLLSSALVAVAAAITGVEGTDWCKPTCSRNSEGDKVQDPTSCNRYYVCGGNGTIAEGPVYCQSGNFSQLAGQCQPGECHPECLFSTMCTPDCSGRNQGEFVEDPLDCTQFYVCLLEERPSDHAVKCQLPTGVFDESEGKCVDGNTCQAPCYLHTCSLKCQGPGYKVADTKDCSYYYECDNDLYLQYRQRCPSNTPYFNGHECVDDVKECCAFRCDPVCGRSDVQIPDPHDCHKYYVCLEEGTPEEAYHFTCPDGNFFNPSSSSCDPGFIHSCDPLCGNDTTTKHHTTNIDN